MSMTTIPGGSLPSNFGQVAKYAKAKDLKTQVNELGRRMASLDQKDGVDLSSDPGKVEVQGATLGHSPLSMMARVSNPLLMLSNETATGTAEYKDGNLTGLSAQQSTTFGANTLNYVTKDDGTQIYSSATPTGQTTVRQNQDGTLFILESPAPSMDDFAKMASDSFDPGNVTASPAPAGTPQGGGLGSWLSSGLGNSLTGGLGASLGGLFSSANTPSNPTPAPQAAPVASPQAAPGGVSSPSTQAHAAPTEPQPAAPTMNQVADNLSQQVEAGANRVGAYASELAKQAQDFAHSEKASQIKNILLDSFSFGFGKKKS